MPTRIELFQALYALAYAVEQTGHEPLMNTWRREGDHKGAFELAKEILMRCPKSWGAQGAGGKPRATRTPR